MVQIGDIVWAEDEAEGWLVARVTALTQLTPRDAPGSSVCVRAQSGKVRVRTCVGVSGEALNFFSSFFSFFLCRLSSFCLSYSPIIARVIGVAGASHACVRLE